ncbi:indole-3-glycerol phosphate synthase TrpC [Eubacterium limosum]|uniref:Indole-3-glycerol phosphate synthase n=1 Tax=Eubacterium limosum TaxID=1736 RepID=A0ABT5UM54_EUBLI|nr:indole-3-glycerol phosphate synthase TrpC [Eubacterium limosum]MCB6568670.1 indole-3-glycerol phosphate synthase TrpC [Eubacterium limosum]MDE1469011.1 indole-3-glycerol phosphate synthase TrpC [Eubacterium limosum]
MILDKLAASARVRVDRLKAERPLESVREEALLIKPEKPFCFEAALKKEDIAFICEVKKASPSKGLIAPDFPYVHIARDYEAAGADAISVLTEPEYFLGSDDYLSAVKRAVNIPVIRKDFTIDPYQIYEARIIGADAVLLICALLDTEALTEYIRIADTLGLTALVEAHDAAEVASALEAGARVIGVNNRNLKTFEVDIENSARLRQLVPEHITFVSESGIKTPGDIDALRKNGTDAVLIGETLMRSSRKAEELARLRGERV